MARYKKYDYNQKRLIAVSFEDQIIPGTFECALDYLIDNDVDLSVFEKRYHNDETGAPAYDPAILLKIVLYAYSRGVISSRKIERLCQSHIIFIALSAESRPHFTTIANFVSSCENEIISVFRDILFVCEILHLSSGQAHVSQWRQCVCEWLSCGKVSWPENSLPCVRGSCSLPEAP